MPGTLTLLETFPVFPSSTSILPVNKNHFTLTVTIQVMDLDWHLISMCQRKGFPDLHIAR